MPLSLDKSVANLKLILTKNKNFVNNLNLQNSMLVWFINFNFTLMINRSLIYHEIVSCGMSDLRIFLSDNINKFLEIDFAVPILIGIINHLFDFGHRKPFANTFADLSKLFDAKKSSLLLIENLKQLFEWFLTIVVGIKTENVKEGGEV